MKLLNVSVAMVVMLVVLVGQAQRAESVTCDPTQLSSCGNAIFYGSTPTPECCAKLQEQRPCFCQYLGNPSLRPYINSANGKRVATYCRTPFPQC